jgi:hypothetical protein
MSVIKPVASKFDHPHHTHLVPHSPHYSIEGWLTDLPSSLLGLQSVATDVLIDRSTDKHVRVLIV